MKKKITPLVVYDDKGKEVEVILKVSEFDSLMEQLEDLYDRKIVRERSKKKEKTYTHEQVVAETLARMKKK